MNLVEVWFGIIEKQAIHRGTFTSVRDLTTKIRAFIDGWNIRARPFTWTKTADQIHTQSQPQDNFKHGALGARCATTPRPTVSGTTRRRAAQDPSSSRGCGAETYAALLFVSHQVRVTPAGPSPCVQRFLA